MSLVRRVFALSTLSALVVAGAPAVGGAQTETAPTPTVTSVIGAAEGLFVLAEVSPEPSPADSEVGVAQELIPFLTFGPAPSVTLPPEGGAVSDEILGVDESELFLALSAGVVSVSAEGALGPDGFATAETTVLDLLLAQQEINNELPALPDSVGVAQETLTFLAAEVISATCEADLDGVSASTTLVGAEAFGEELDEQPEPNTVLDLSLIDVDITVLLNGQEENPDGSLSVVPLALAIESEGVSIVLEVGPATCGVVEGEEAAEIVPAPDELGPAPPLRVTPRFTG